MSTLIYLILALPFLLLLLPLLMKKQKNANLPPGPAGLPILGNLLQLDPSAPHRYLWQLSHTYGPLMSLRLGSAQILVVSTAKMAEQVMKTHDLIFCNRPTALGPKKLSYNFLDLAFAPYDAYWRQMRKLCMVHLFSANRVQSYAPIREHEVSKMLHKIAEAGSNKPFNLSAAMMSLTNTIICQVAFGKRFEDEGTDQRSRFQSLLNESQAMFTSFFFSDHFPFLGFLDRLTGLTSRLDKNFRELDVFYQEIIDEHLDPNRAKPEQDDILDVLLQILKDKSLKVELKSDHIKAILMNIFVGGTDTSAATVVWAMTYLIKNPIAMRKAQEEVRKAVRKKGFVKEEGIEQLSYLKAVVKEAMRLQPTAPLLIPRLSSEDCRLGGYEIAANTVVQVNAWAIGRDKEAWGENPEEFKPERFLEGKSIDFKGADFELIPFGAGRRICPAMHMGIANVELSLANLLYAFDWRMPDGMKSEDLDMDVLPGLTMHKKNALFLVATKFM
ncbi:Cytochrome P450 83B1 [Linum grandiflorum]